MLLSTSAQANELVSGFNEIGLERAGCLGSCPMYSVTVRGDGTVVYKGVGNVKLEGERHSRILKSDLSFLIAAFEYSTFFSLRDNYSSLEDGCKSEVTDYPGITLSFRSPTKSKRVYFYYGCEGVNVEATISWLAHVIDMAAGTRRWVGSRDAP